MLYNYVNRYLGDSLNNFVCEKLIGLIFICATTSVKMKFYMFKTTDE